MNKSSLLTFCFHCLFDTASSFNHVHNVLVLGERAQLDVIDNDDDPEDFPDASGSSGGASSESSSSGPSRTPPSSRRGKNLSDGY